MPCAAQNMSSKPSKRATPVLAADEARTLLDSIPIVKAAAEANRPDLVGLRDRALIGLMAYSFARVGAVLQMKVGDYFVQERSAQYDPEIPTSLMICQDGQAFKDQNGDLRAQNVMDNLIYRRENPVMIGVFINPGRMWDQPEPSPQTSWGDDTTNRRTEYNRPDDKYARVITTATKMTKTELQSALAEATQTDKKTAGVFLDTLSALAYKEIKKNGEFVLPGFGKLVKQKRKARTGFNPKSIIIYDHSKGTLEITSCRLALWQVLLLLPSGGPRVGKSMSAAPPLACFQRPSAAKSPVLAGS
jgi:nucleoid DNA-binding protein